MNIERLAHLVRKIEAKPQHWDQTHWHNECGTAHCLFGLAQIELRGDPEWRDIRYIAILDGRTYLEATDHETIWLSDPRRTLDDFRQVIRDGCIP